MQQIVSASGRNEMKDEALEHEVSVQGRKRKTVEGQAIVEQNLSASQRSKKEERGWLGE